jgi:hypothetical protein
MSLCQSREDVLRHARSILRDVSLTSSNRTLLYEQGDVSVTDQAGQTLFWKRERDSVRKIILHLLRSHIVSTESRHPGSGEVCARAGSSIVDMWMRRELSGEDPSRLSREVTQTIDLILSSPARRRRLRSDDIFSFTACLPESLRETTTRLVSESSLGTTFAVKQGKTLHSCVSTVAGLSARVETDPRLTSQPRLIRPKAVLIDGTIDSVGQIHRVLEDSSQTGQEYLILCRGASHEVVQTIAVNSARGTVRALLAFSRLDDLTVGSLEDVCEYTGAWIISAHSGDSVSSGFDRLHPVNGSVWIEGGTLRCDCPPSDRLAQHVSRLRSDAVRGDQSVYDFLQARIVGLSSSRIDLTVGLSDTRRDASIIEKIDSEMRALSASFTRGVIDEYSLPGEMSISHKEALAAIVPQGVRSAGSVESGLIEGLRFARALCTIGHAVIV